jgi:hypothetical protein
LGYSVYKNFFKGQVRDIQYITYFNCKL